MIFTCGEADRSSRSKLSYFLLLKGMNKVEEEAPLIFITIELQNEV